MYLFLIISLILCHFLELFYFIRKESIQRRNLEDFIKRYKEWLKQNEKKEGQ